MRLNFSDIVELVRVLVWPVFIIFVLLYFKESIVSLLSRVSKSHLKSVKMPFVSLDFYEGLKEKIEQTLNKDGVSKVERDVALLQIRVLYIQKILTWVLDNGKFNQDLSEKDQKRFFEECIEDVMEKREKNIPI